MCVRANNCAGSPTPPSWDVEIAKYAALAYVSYNVSIRATAARQLISTPFPSSDAFWVPILPILWVGPHVCNHDHNYYFFAFTVAKINKSINLPVLEFLIIVFIWIVDVFAHFGIFPFIPRMFRNAILMCVGVGVGGGVLFSTLIFVPPFL